MRKIQYRSFFKNIYSSDLQLIKENISISGTSFLDLSILIQNEKFNTPFFCCYFATFSVFYIPSNIYYASIGSDSVYLFVSVFSMIFFASVWSILASIYFHIFMLSSVGILYCNFTIIQYRFTKYNIVLFFQFVLLFIHSVVHIGISNHVYISTHYCPNNMYCICCLLLSVCLLFDHDIPNASLYLCLFLYIYASIYVLKCWHCY